MTGVEQGWDSATFARFQAAKPGGPLRRLLASQLLKANEPLIKTLVGQLLGRQERRYCRLGKVFDGDRLEWEDALQAGFIGFARALETYDPSKCKIAAYARWWIRYELQKQTPVAATIRTPLRKEAERPQTALVGQPKLEALAGLDFGGLAAVDGLTPEMVQAWAESGEWPDTLEEAVPRLVVAVPAEPPITPWNAFLRDVVRLRPAARSVMRHVHDAFVRHQRSLGVVMSERPRALGKRLGVSELTVAIRGTPYRAWGFKGVELRGFAQPGALGT